ncbi:MAG: helix-turn-helix transcriptional regulator, partial [Planctomycetota bacterium]
MKHPWQIIESLRIKKGVSKKILAERLGINYSYLVDLLNGRYPSKIDNQKLQIISEVFEIPIVEIISELSGPPRFHRGQPSNATPGSGKSKLVPYGIPLGIVSPAEGGTNLKKPGLPPTPIPPIPSLSQTGSLKHSPILPPSPPCPAIGGTDVNRDAPYSRRNWTSERPLLQVPLIPLTPGTVLPPRLGRDSAVASQSLGAVSAIWATAAYRLGLAVETPPH